MAFATVASALMRWDCGSCCSKTTTSDEGRAEQRRVRQSAAWDEMNQRMELRRRDWNAQVIVVVIKQVYCTEPCHRHTINLTNRTKGEKKVTHESL